MAITIHKVVSTSPYKQPVQLFKQDHDLCKIFISLIASICPNIYITATAVRLISLLLPPAISAHHPHTETHPTIGIGSESHDVLERSSQRYDGAMKDGLCEDGIATTGEECWEDGIERGADGLGVASRRR